MKLAKNMSMKKHIQVGSEEGDPIIVAHTYISTVQDVIGEMAFVIENQF
jgi:hypothetical protein